LSLPDKVTVESLGNRVGGIARPESGRAVFVRGALPGETVRIGKLVEKKNFIEAELLSIEEPSPFRTEPFCEYYGRCGGCSLQHLEYSRELHWKRKWIEKALRGLDTPEVEPAVPSPDQRGCRNRITFHVHRGRLCLHAFRGDPIPVNSCPLINPAAVEVLLKLKKATLPEKLKKVSVRGAVHTGDGVMEFSGVPAKIPPDHKLTVYKSSGKTWQLLSGNGMKERMGNFVFPVPPGGFFQVNTKAAEILVDTVSEMVPGTSGNVLDLYGGVGTFGIPLAARGFNVDSVESNREASEACTEAAGLNRLSGLSVVCRTDRSYLSHAIRRGRSFDILVTDPPRTGMGIEVAGLIGKLFPEIIVYVSCNPFTAGRDIAVLVKRGYRIKRIVPVDLFPRTDHVETVFLLEGGGE